VFANIVLADELNRGSPRTQSALLECMQERQVTVDGVARPLAAPFFVVATQNPIEQDGTFPLPEAQLDRFALRLALGYPEAGAEARMLADQTAPDGSPLDTLAAVADAAELIAAVHACRSVHVAPALHDYVVALCGATRADPRLALGASPRAGVTLIRLARAHALIQGRDHVLPDDVKELATDALAHRLLPAAGAPADVASVVEELLARVPVPL
jgi:MoxR-like ATPase